MSWVHLLWIIPVVFFAGFCFAGLLVCAKDDPVREIKEVRTGRTGL